MFVCFYPHLTAWQEARLLFHCSSVRSCMLSCHCFSTVLSQVSHGSVQFHFMCVGFVMGSGITMVSWSQVWQFWVQCQTLPHCDTLSLLCGIHGFPITIDFFFSPTFLPTIPSTSQGCSYNTQLHQSICPHGISAPSSSTVGFVIAALTFLCYIDKLGIYPSFYITNSRWPLMISTWARHNNMTQVSYRWLPCTHQLFDIKTVNSYAAQVLDASLSPHRYPNSSQHIYHTC